MNSYKITAVSKCDEHAWVDVMFWTYLWTMYNECSFAIRYIVIHPLSKDTCIEQPIETLRIVEPCHKPAFLSSWMTVLWPRGGLWQSLREYIFLASSFRSGCSQSAVRSDGWPIRLDHRASVMTSKACLSKARQLVLWMAPAAWMLVSHRPIWKSICIASQIIATVRHQRGWIIIELSANLDGRRKRD